ncbi:MAG: PEP-CTERM sorting domain-containing protein [Thermoguttaceae bacterium]|nr:PEP-CTERM sorting domain-containing protein [Thermoguttaceae bacterium]
MKNAYRLFVVLLVCATSALAFADEVIVENASNKSEILSPMPQNSVWVQGTTELIRLYDGTTAGVPANTPGLKIGGTDATSQIKVLTSDMQNLAQTTVLTNGDLSISSSDTGNSFSNTLSIDGGKVLVEKATYNLDNGGAITISSGSMGFSGRFRLGYNSEGAFTQTGGTVTLNTISGSDNDKYLRIGYYSGAEGTLNISGGTFTTPLETRIGDSGTGTINLSGGVFNQTGGWANLGYEASGKGYMTVSGGTFNYTGNDFRVGRAGHGELNLESGTFNLGSKALVIGYYEGSTGEFTMTGGTLTANALTLGEKAKTSDKAAANGTATFTNIANQSFAGDVVVGSYGTGSLALDNSSFSTSGYLFVGRYEGSSGEVTLKNGASFSFPSHTPRIGQTGTGVVNVLSGSTLDSSSKDIHIGYDAAGDGTLTIDGGTVNSKIVMVGNSGTGKLEVKSGTLNAGTSHLYAGNNAGANGTINISGGTVTAGDLRIGENGTGESNISGGAVTFNTIMYAGLNNQGTINISDSANVTVKGNIIAGYNTIPTESNPISGNLNISGGTVTTNGSALIGNNANAVGSVSVSGGTLTVKSELRVGDSGVGTMTITGGDTTVTGAVNVGFETGSVGNLFIKNGTFTNANSASSFRIGHKGTGTVEVLQGGQLIVENTQTQLGYYSGSNGTLTIDGGTANLNTLQVGYASGATGELNVLGGKLNVFNEISVGYDGTGSAAISGGVVTAGDFVVKSGMSAALNGGTLNVVSYVNEGSTTLAGSTINLGANGFINSAGAFTATNGSVIVNPGDYYSESDQVLIGRFADANTANSVKNLTTVPEGWTTAVVDFSGSSAVIAQYGSEPTDVKIWNAGTEGNMSSADSWSGNTSNNTGFVLGGTNKFKDFAGDLVIVDGTNTFSINAPVPSGHILVNDGGTTTYGSGDISMNGTLIVNDGTFQTASGKTLVIAGTETAPAYLEVNGGNLITTRRLTIGNVASSDKTKSSAKVVINGGNVQIGASSGGLHIGEMETAGVAAELELNGGALQVNNNRPSYFGSTANSSAKFTMTNGNFTTGGVVYLATGDSSTGTMTISGGTFSMTSDLNVATGASSNGTIDVSDGTFTTTGALIIATGANSTGTLNISGGTFTTTNTLRIAIEGNNSTGIVNVSGGYMKVNSIRHGRADAGDSALLNITGGIVEVTNAIYGVSSDSVQPGGNIKISGTGQLLLNSTYSNANLAGIRGLTKFEIEGAGDGSGALRFLESLDSSVPITLTNDATIGINAGAVFNQREAINIVPKRSAQQPALTVTGGGTLVLTNSELGSLDELTIDDDTTVKIDNPGNTTNLHMSSIVLNNGALEVTEGTILDPGYENDELPTTVAIEGDGRVIIRGALFLDAYTTDKATGMDKLDFSDFDGDLTLANPLNLTVHLDNANDFLGQVVTLDWLIADAPEELYNIDNVKMTLINDEGISFIYWLNADGTLTFGDHNAIPEPSTWALLILGAAGLLYWRKRKN